MAVAKEQIRQIISENNISSVADVYMLLKDSFKDIEYYGAAEPPVRCGESHLSGLTEPPHFVY